MAGSTRITIRLPEPLVAHLSDRIGQGATMSDIVRQALEAYFFGDTPREHPGRPTGHAGVSDAITTLSDSVSDIQRSLSDVVSDVADMRHRLAQLEQRQPAAPRPGRTPAVTRQPGTTGRGISPEVLAAITEARTQHPDLSLRDFAQWLYDEHIYRTAGGSVVNAGTLQRWLAQSGAQS